MGQQIDIFTETTQVDSYAADSYTGIYGVHKYWSKKPYNIIRAFVQKYSDRGNVILDPFCGSGISVIESILTDRKAIGIDINPSAIFITKQTLTKISTSKLYDAFKAIEKSVKGIINSFYEVKRNSGTYQGTHFLWENEQLTEVWYRNEIGKKIIDIPTEDDIKLSDSFTVEGIDAYFPQENFFHNPRINAYGNKSINDLFTVRNLKALSILMKAIEEIKDRTASDILKFCFTSSVGQASKMVFVVKNRGKMDGKARRERKEVGSWVIGYWTPRENFEINVWNCFESRFNKVMKAKKVQERAPYSIRETDNFVELLYSDYNLMLLNSPAQIALRDFPNNSIDYVITDPPHGDRIPYLELSLMWNSWLKKTADYKNEIIVSDAKERKMDFDSYSRSLNLVFDEIQRVLKPEKYFTLMFNSLDDETWTNLISKLHSLDFELLKVETLGYSANSVVQDTRKAGLKTDFIMTFQKKRHLEKPDIDMLSVKLNRRTIKEALESLFETEGKKGVETYQILNFLFKYFLNQNKFFKTSEIQTLLSEEYEFKEKKWFQKKR